MQQHAARRINAQPGEQLGIAQGQLDHFAQLPDGITHTANIIVIDVCPRSPRFLKLLTQFDLGILVNMDDALGVGADDQQANLGEGKSRCIEHPRHFGRHIAHLLLAGGGNQVSGKQRPPEEVALQCLRRTLQPHFLLRRGKNHTARRARFGFPDRDMIARTNIGIGALKPVQPDHLQPLILSIGQHRAGSGKPLAGDLQRIAFHNAKRCHRRLGQPGNAVPALFLPRGGDLSLTVFSSMMAGASARGSPPR